jgi:ABC-type enterochelin transport system permease subunit
VACSYQVLYIHKQHVHGSFKLADRVTTGGHGFELQKKLKIYFNLVMRHAGDQILFLMLNSVSVIGLVLTFKPFFSLDTTMRRS